MDESKLWIVHRMEAKIMAVMKFVVSCVMIFTFGCKSLERNRAEHDTSTTSDSKSEGKEAKMVIGRCEMLVVGQNQALPCSAVKLLAKSTRGHEQRTASVDGFNFRFDDMNEETYDLEVSAKDFSRSSFSSL